MRFILSCLLVALFSAPVIAQENNENTITTQKVNRNIYMLSGKGGNIGLFIGKNNVLMIDDKFPEHTENITKKITELTPKPVKYLINTHYHFDHTGGNVNLGKSGAIIVAHKNIRERLSTDQFIKFFDVKMPATPTEGLPVITFTQDINFHLDNEDINVTHHPHAHTDGDAIIHFKNANIVHTGDIYFNGMYPFIDVNAGGSASGVIKAATDMLLLMDSTTKIIPGHGPISNIEEFKNYINMLKTIHNNIKKLVDEGKNLQQIVNAKPTRDFDEGINKGFISPEQFTEIMYNSITKDNKK